MSRDTELEALAEKWDGMHQAQLHSAANDLRAILATPSPGTLHGELRELIRKAKADRSNFHALVSVIDLDALLVSHPAPAPQRDATFALPDTVQQRVDKVLREARVKVNEYLALEKRNAVPLDPNTVYGDNPAPTPATREAIAQVAAEHLKAAVSAFTGELEKLPSMKLRGEHLADRIMALIDGGGLLSEAIEALRELCRGVVDEVNAKGGGGYVLARLSDARDLLARYDARTPPQKPQCVKHSALSWDGTETCTCPVEKQGDTP